MRTIAPGVLAAAVLASWLAAPGLAQETDQHLREDIEALKEGQRQIQQQLDELTKLVKARPAAAAGRAAPDVKGKVFDLADNEVVGERTAKLTLVEFTDYQ